MTSHMLVVVCVCEHVTKGDGSGLNEPVAAFTASESPLSVYLLRILSQEVGQAEAGRRALVYLWSRC